MHQAVRCQHVTLYLRRYIFLFCLSRTKFQTKYIFFSCGFTESGASFKTEKRCGAHLRATCLRAALRCQRMQMLVLYALC